MEQSVELILQRDGEACTVRIAGSSGAGEASATIPWSQIMQQAIQGEALYANPRSSLADAEGLGYVFYSTFFPDRLHTVLQRVIGSSSSSLLQLVVKYERDKTLDALPWEILHDGNCFLLRQPKFQLIRYSEQMDETKPLVTIPPVRVLLTTASPEGVEALDLAGEERLIRSGLMSLMQDDVVDLFVEHNVSLGKLRHILQYAESIDSPFHLWHHCGHGFQMKETFVLLLEKAGAVEDVGLSQIETMVDALPGLRMAVFNVCHSGASVGLAPALARLNVPAVLAFRNAISDTSALLFAKVFYPALFHGPVSMALGHARSALATERNQTLEWASPVLYQRTTDSLFIMPSKAKTPTTLKRPADQITKAYHVTNTIGSIHIGTVKGRVINIGGGSYVDTGGGAYISGDADVEGDLTGRDNIEK